MFEEKSGKDAIPPGNCSRRYQNRGCSKKFKIIRFPLRSDPLLTFTTLEEASLSYTFHKKICAPFKPTFEYQTDRFRNPLKNLKPGKGRSNGRSPPHKSHFRKYLTSPSRKKINRLVASNKMLTWPKMWRNTFLCLSDDWYLGASLIYLQYLSRIRRMASEGK